MSSPSDIRRPTHREVAHGFVDSDMAELALHMARCAQARGALFALKRQLHRGSRTLGGHIVTVAFVGLSLVAVASMLA